MPIPGVVQRIDRESAGQVLLAIGATEENRAQSAPARSRFPPRWDLRTAGQPSRGASQDSVLLPWTLAAVVSHGLAKERVVPPKEIDRAVERKRRFEANPHRHTYEEI
jgi:hypothetical protein